MKRCRGRCRTEGCCFPTRAQVSPRRRREVPPARSQDGSVAEEHVRFVDLAASARAFMSAVRALSNPPRANEQLNGCGRSFRASSRQRADCGRASATELSLELRSTSDGGSRPKFWSGLSSSRIDRMMYATLFESRRIRLLEIARRRHGLGDGQLPASTRGVKPPPIRCNLRVRDLGGATSSCGVGALCMRRLAVASETVSPYPP